MWWVYGCSPEEREAEKYKKLSIQHRHDKKWFVPHKDDLYIVVTTPTGGYTINYRYVQDYMSIKERNKLLKLAVENGGWKLKIGGAIVGNEKEDRKS